MAVLSMPNRADTAALPTRTERQARLLAAMRDARHEQESLLRQQEDLVDWARSEGVTWDEIATALGLSNSGARLAYRRRRGDRGERVTLP